LPVGPCRARSTRLRTVGDRAVNLRRIDGARSGNPHGRGGAQAGPPQNRSTRRVRPRSALVWMSAGDRRQQLGISTRLAWRRPTTRPAPGPRLWVAAVSGHWGSRPASQVYLKRTESRAYADVPALSRYHPAACFANSPALPRTNARHNAYDGRRSRVPFPAQPHVPYGISQIF
jgi:hypothetical protein